MSDSQWRIDLAREISGHYDAQCIVVVGSPALRIADAYSDLDLVMFWHDVPDDDARLQLGSRYGCVQVVAGFDTSAEFSLQYAAEVVYVGENNLKVDITHKSLSAQSQMIDEVVVGFDNNRSKLAQIRNLSVAITIRGQETLDNWRNRYQPMPRLFTETLLQGYLHFWAHQPLQKLVIERDDVFFARQLMIDNCEKIVLAICVINGIYPPDKPKHLRVILQGLAQPTKTIQRIQSVCNQPVHKAHHSLKSLIEDVFDIADQFGYNTANARQHYATVRQNNGKAIQLQTEER